jgi:hypothetical protein
VRRAAALTLLLVLGPAAAASANHEPPRWTPVPTGSDQQYRGLVPFTCWASGPAGAVAILER